MPTTKRGRPRKRGTSRTRSRRETQSGITEDQQPQRGRKRRGPRPRVAGDGIIPKVLLAEEISTIIRYRHLNQTEAAAVVGDAPSQISLLMGGRIQGFSIERLLRMLLRLGRDIELVFRATPGTRAGKFRISHDIG